MGSDTEILNFVEGETVEFTRPLLDLEGNPSGEFVVVLTWLGIEESDYGSPRRIQMGLTQHYSMFIDLKPRDI